MRRAYSYQRDILLLLYSEFYSAILSFPFSSFVICNWLAETHILFEVPASAFTPPPKITSAVIQLIPRQSPVYECRFSDLEKVTQIAFNQRRKMLRASFKHLGGEKMISALGIDPQIRPQELSTQAFCKLANHLSSQL